MRHMIMVILLLAAVSLCTDALAETGHWPISHSSASTADVLVSAYGPRYLGEE